MDRGMIIYENLQRLAYERGLTVQKMCNEAKVSAGSIGDLKAGRRNNIGKVTVDKLVKFLGCTEEDIMNDPIVHQPIPESPKADRLEGFYAKAMDSMHERPEMRRLVRAAMKANTQQVKSTAILLESITQAYAEGGIITDDGE